MQPGSYSNHGLVLAETTGGAAIVGSVVRGAKEHYQRIYTMRTEIDLLPTLKCMCKTFYTVTSELISQLIRKF